MCAESEEMSRVERTAVDGVYRLEFEVPWPPNHVAAYLIDAEGEDPILIDAGSPSDDGKTDWSRTLGCVGYEPDDISDVIVTHPHSDHIGKVPELREAGADVHAPAPAIEQLLRSEEDLEAGVREVGREVGYDDDRLDSAVDKAVSSLQRNRRLLEPDRTHPLAYDEFVVGGRTFEAYRTPGHQIHHAVFLTDVSGEKILLSGDAIVDTFRPAALHTGIDHGAFDAIDAFFAAMDTLERLDVDTVLPGHGPVFSDLGGAVEYTREKLENLLGGTAAAVESVGPASPANVAEEHWGEVKHPGQVLDVIGALGTLERRGVVAFTVGDDGVRYYETA